MSNSSYILKRFFASIPLLIVVSIISFGIIRLNLRITAINLSFLIFPPISILVFYFFGKLNNWKLYASLCSITLMFFSYYLSKFSLLPFDLLFEKGQVSFILNFLVIISFFSVYLIQSYIGKSNHFSRLVILIALLLISFNVSSKLPINIPIQEVVLKSGDPLADLRFNPAISKEALKKEELRLGLNKPMHEQYLLWLRGVLHGDLGITQQNQEVVQIIKRPLLNTLLLSLCTLFCTWLIAIPLGIWAALNRNKFIDKLLSFLTSCGMSTPSFILAILGLLFALRTQVLPIGGMTSNNFYELSTISKLFDIAKHLILPTTVLTLISIASLQRQMRANLLDVLRQEYINTARAKGLPTNKVVYKHALRNAINPLITIFGFEFASLLSGAALTETVLAYPGLGALTLEAARKLDVNLTMTTLIMGATMLIIGNLIADLLLKVADPRIKLGST